MSAKRPLFKIIFFLSLIFAPFHAFAQINLGSDFLHPSVAYDTQNQKYLVVYEKKDSATSSKIYGRLYNRDSSPQGEELLISTDRPTEGCFYKDFDAQSGDITVPQNCDVNARPSVAYNEGQFLVVWESRGIAPQNLDAPNNQFSNLIGKLLNANSLNPVSDIWDEGILLGAVSIASTSNERAISDDMVQAWGLYENPAVSARSGAKGFLLSFESNRRFIGCDDPSRRGAKAIYGRYIDDTFRKAAGANQPIFEIFIDSSFASGKCSPLENVISAGNVKLAYNSSRGEFLASFSCALNGMGEDICLERIKLDNANAASVPSNNIQSQILVSSKNGSIEGHDLIAYLDHYVAVVSQSGSLSVSNISAEDLENLSGDESFTSSGIEGINPRLASNLGADGQSIPGEAESRIALVFERSGEIGAALFDNNLSLVQDLGVVSSGNGGQHDVSVSSDLTNFTLIWAENDSLVKSAFIKIFDMQEEQAPTSPSNLTAQGVSTESIQLNWTASERAESYSIERGESDCNEESFSEIKVQLVNQGTAYLDSGFSAHTSYCYRVRAANAFGFSDYSNTVVGTTEDNPVTAPAAPQNLNVQGISTDTIRITWSQSPSSSGYKLERGNSDCAEESFEQIALLMGIAATTHNDSGWAPETSFCYRVRAYNDAGDSVYSSTAQGSTLADSNNPPAAPANLTAEGISNNTIHVTWDFSLDAESYHLERGNAACEDASFEEIQVLNGVNSTSYNDGGHDAEQSFCYRVFASNENGDSAYSNTDLGQTLSDPINPPAAPANLNAQGISHNTIRITWDLSIGTDSYHLERGNADCGNGSFVVIAVLEGVASTQYDDMGLEPESSYCYRVFASNDDGNSPLSNTNVGTTLEEPANPPAAPGNLIANALDHQSIQVTWNVSIGADSYTLERGNAACNPGSFVVIANLPGVNSTNYMDANGLAPETSYCYRVLASNSDGNSPYSNTNVATTDAIPLNPPQAPENLQANGLDSDSIQISWSVSAGAESYTLERGNAACDLESFAQLQVLVGLNNTNYQDDGLDAETSYCYRVLASNLDGNSPYSALVVGSTLEVPNQAPSSPILHMLGDNELVSPVNDLPPVRAYLNWEASVDPEGDAVVYDLYFWKDGEAEDAHSRLGITDTFYVVGPENADPGELGQELRYNTNYHWRVVARDNLGNSSAPSATFDFNTDDSVVAWYRFDSHPGGGFGGMGCFEIWQNDPEVDALADPKFSVAKTLCDYSRHHNDGAKGMGALPGFLQPGDPSYMPDWIQDGVWTFDGMDDFVQVANDDSLQLNEAITIEAKIYLPIVPISNTVLGSIVGKDRVAPANAGNFQLQRNFDNGRFEFQFFSNESPSNVRMVTDNVPMLPGTTALLAVVHEFGNGQETKIIFNNSVVPSNWIQGTGDEEVVLNSNSMSLGANTSGINHFNNMTQDELVIYNKVLSEQERQNGFLSR